MRYLFTLLPLLLLAFGCREKSVLAPLPLPVTSVADLAATNQPVEGGVAIAGRLKSNIHNGKTSGEWRYNERGQLLEWRRFSAGQISSADQYRYDGAGKLRFVQHFDNNCGYSSRYDCTGPVLWTSYDDLTTDTAGRVTESRTYLNIAGNWVSRSSRTYVYNQQGQLTTVRQYDDKQVLARTETLTYDAGGNVMAVREQSTTAPADLADRTFRYAYDPAGRNPFYNTVYFASAFFLSRNIQLTPGSTYEYRPDGLPRRTRQGENITDFIYY